MSAPARPTMRDSPFKIAPPSWRPGQTGASDRGRTELVLLAALVIGVSAAALLTALISLEPLPLAIAAGRVGALALLARGLFRGSDAGLWSFAGVLAVAIGLLVILDSEPGGAVMRLILAVVYGAVLLRLLTSPSVRAFRDRRRAANTHR